MREKRKTIHDNIHTHTHTTDVTCSHLDFKIIFQLVKEHFKRAGKSCVSISSFILLKENG